MHATGVVSCNGIASDFQPGNVVIIPAGQILADRRTGDVFTVLTGLFTGADTMTILAAQEGMGGNLAVGTTLYDKGGRRFTVLMMSGGADPDYTPLPDKWWLTPICRAADRFFRQRTTNRCVGFM